MNSSKEYSVIIVCDGTSPVIAANSLCKYIGEEAIIRGQKCSSKVISASDYRDDLSKHNKIIIIGHHKLALDYYASADECYSNYGMKYAYLGENIAILCASRSELGNDGTGKKAFAGFYNRTIQSYNSLAEKFDIPQKFGRRNTTQQSQYDLLWIIFAEESCMNSFLDMPYADVEKMSQDQIVESALKSIMDKVEANSDHKIRIALRRKDDDFDEAENNNIETVYLEPDIITDLQNNRTMDFLRSHLNYDIYMTDMWQRNKETTIVPKDELLDGEIDAILVRVGCYLVRYATRVYVDDYNKKLYSSERHPVVGEQLNQIKELLKKGSHFIFFSAMENPALSNCEIFKEISAKHISELENDDSNYHFICMILVNLKGMSSFSLGTVATVKEKQTDDDSSAKLYVQEQYIGSSFSSETWYIYSRDGSVNDYHISGYDSDSWNRK